MQAAASSAGTASEMVQDEQMDDDRAKGGEQKNPSVDIGAAVSQMLDAKSLDEDRQNRLELYIQMAKGIVASNVKLVSETEVKCH